MKTLKENAQIDQLTERLISIKTVSQQLGISSRAVYRLIAKNEFPRPVKVGAATRFYESDLTEYLNRLREARSLASKR